MRLDPIFTKAIRLLRRKKYDGAMRTLEPEVNRYRGSFRYYYLLGLSCLYAGDFGGAFTYFKLARDVKMRDPSVLLGFAALYLRRGETDRAVDFYLEVQDVDERNKTAQKALKIIRKYSRNDTLSDWIDSGRLSTIFPPLPPVPVLWYRLVLTLLFFLFFGSAVCAGVLVYLRVLPNPIKYGAKRDGFISSALDWDERRDPVQSGGDYRYVLTKTQILDTYEDARAFFTKHRDEQARVAINRLLESNASDSIKNKALLLISYLDVPGFDTLKERFSYLEVISEPALYRDCHVIWRGMAANVEMEQHKTFFNFLVGYDTRSVLEGMVPVVFNFSVSINPERPLEVLGKIVPVLTEKGQEIRLEGVALHQAGVLLNSGK